MMSMICRKVRMKFLFYLFHELTNLKDFDFTDEEPRNTHVYSSIQSWYLVPEEFDGCPCVAEEEQFDLDNNTVPVQFKGVFMF